MEITSDGSEIWEKWNVYLTELVLACSYWKWSAYLPTRKRKCNLISSTPSKLPKLQLFKAPRTPASWPCGPFGFWSRIDRGLGPLDGSRGYRAWGSFCFPMGAAAWWLETRRETFWQQHLAPIPTCRCDHGSECLHYIQQLFSLISRYISY